MWRTRSCDKPAASPTWRRLWPASTAAMIASARSPRARSSTRARVLERARSDLAETIVEAVDAGHSLRQVGEAAGLSHERVRHIVRAR